MSDAAISAATRALVIERARECCEYCLIHQNSSPYTHEVDHLVARTHGGTNDPDNLCLACLPCNRRKGSDLTAIDPISGQIVPLFSPRTQKWTEHFVLEGAYIVGKTETGRATVFLLALNAPSRLVKRQLLIAEGTYP
ncbi:MAG: HNH endonuclease [Caldilineaceae bacterium]|nr:HNH endonuclease [Caldilineaceae bacterium]